MIELNPREGNAMGDELKPCPFCGGEMMFRKALWPSDGDTDAVIHAYAFTHECGMRGFDIGTADEGVIAAWNRRAASPVAADTMGDAKDAAQPQSVTVETLRQHWLHAMECDHATGRDKPHCACSRVDLGWHPSVGAAVEAWLTHVSGAAITEGKPDA